MKKETHLVRILLSEEIIVSIITVLSKQYNRSQIQSKFTLKKINVKSQYQREIATHETTQPK